MIRPRDLLELKKNRSNKGRFWKMDRSSKKDRSAKHDRSARVEHDNMPLIQGAALMATGLLLHGVARRRRTPFGRTLGTFLLGLGTAHALHGTLGGHDHASSSAQELERERERRGERARPVVLAELRTGRKRGRRRRIRMLRSLAEILLAGAWLRQAGRRAAGTAEPGERPRQEPAMRAQAAAGTDASDNVEETLDHALEETFPASDPVTITPPERREPPIAL